MFSLSETNKIFLFFIYTSLKLKEIEWDACMDSFIVHAHLMIGISNRKVQKTFFFFKKPNTCIYISFCTYLKCWRNSNRNKFYFILQIKSHSSFLFSSLRHESYFFPYHARRYFLLLKLSVKAFLSSLFLFLTSRYAF